MKIKFWVIDVDGTMTDAGIYYDEYGNEFKKFCTKDAVGFFAAHKAGMKTIVLTGRECAATIRRMNELKVDYLFQNIKDKRIFLEQFMSKHHIHSENLGYIGDDLNDLEPMHLAGYIACPANSCPEIKQIANYISPVYGGAGAVRDVIENYLRKNDMWDFLIKTLYVAGT